MRFGTQVYKCVISLKKADSQTLFRVTMGNHDSKWVIFGVMSIPIE